MTWFDNIRDLQYYHQPKGVPCYCEAVAYPFDMYLQGQVRNGNGDYTVTLYVYSADGLTEYENATSYFDIYTGVMPNGQHFFNARLKAFSPEMCEHECYVIKALVVQSDGVKVFEKYTERYCQNNCCDMPRNITLDQAGFQPMVIGNTTNDPTIPIIDTTLPDPTIYIPAGNCGEQLIRIISKFDCVDNFTGDFYNIPENVLGGNADFEYRKITTIKGRIVRRPREITRELSYNCKLQRAESTAQYLLEGFEYLPPWKMYEIEGQLHANSLFIDDFAGVREYQYAGGTPMKQISNCFELFKLEATLQDCTQRQVFGCQEKCYPTKNPDGSNIMFVIPAAYNGGGFYNSTRQLVATDYTGLIDYLRTRTGATAAEDVDTGSMDCAPYKVISVTSAGQVDSHIYYDAPAAGNKVYGVVVNNLNDLCAGLPAVCAKPVAGVIEVDVWICAVPVAGTFGVEDIAVDELVINGHGDWEKVNPETSGIIYANEVTFSLKVVNSLLAEDPEAPGEDVYVNQVIGVMGGSGRPSSMVMLSQYNNPLPDDVTILIDTNGNITYYGPAAATPDDLTIDLNNLTYNI